MNSAERQMEDENESSDFKPLSAQEADAWRARQPKLSIWRVIALQVAVGVLVSVCAGLFAGRVQAAWSAGYGALSVVLPALIFARALVRKRQSTGAALLGLFGWELVKIVVTVAMLAAAPRMVPGLSWLALLVGMVVVIKTYWVALLMLSGVRRTG